MSIVSDHTNFAKKGTCHTTKVSQEKQREKLHQAPKQITTVASIRNLKNIGSTRTGGNNHLNLSGISTIKPAFAEAGEHTSKQQSQGRDPSQAAAHNQTTQIMHRRPGRKIIGAPQPFLSSQGNQIPTNKPTKVTVDKIKGGKPPEQLSQTQYVIGEESNIYKSLKNAN